MLPASCSGSSEVTKGVNVEKTNLMQGRGRFQISATERTTLAAALIVGLVLVGSLHAPPGPVLVGCAMALAIVVANRWRKGR